MKAYLLRLADEFIKELRAITRLMYTGTFLGMGMLLGIMAAWSFFDWASGL